MSQKALQAVRVTEIFVDVKCLQNCGRISFNLPNPRYNVDVMIRIYLWYFMHSDWYR